MATNHSLLYVFCISITLFFYYAQALIEQTKPIYGSHQLVTYVVDWDVPKVIPWSKLDHIAYAFAVPDQDGELTLFNETQLNKGNCHFSIGDREIKIDALFYYYHLVVEEAHNHGKGVSLAIGG